VFCLLVLLVGRGNDAGRFPAFLERLKQAETHVIGINFCNPWKAFAKVSLAFRLPEDG
jgi:hypothetical protein